MSRRRLGLRKRLALNIFSELYASTVREHRLDTLFWECTLRCNLSCRHCGSDCRVDPGVADMPLADFLKVLDEEVTPHVDPADVLVIFSGGEVLVRADLEEAGAEVTRRGYPWGMVTNGMALTPERFGRLLDAGLRSVSDRPRRLRTRGTTTSGAMPAVMTGRWTPCGWSCANRRCRTMW